MGPLIQLFLNLFISSLTEKAATAVVDGVREKLASQPDLDLPAQSPPTSKEPVEDLPRGPLDPATNLAEGKDFSITVRELTASDVAERAGRAVVVESYSEVHIALTALVLKVLAPVREHFDRGLIPTSGYRPLWLNRMVGSKDNSQHTQGQACDFRMLGITPLEVCEYLQSSTVPFDQLILEFPSAAAPQGAWVHVSHTRFGPNRRQVLTAYKPTPKSAVVYRPGLWNLAKLRENRLLEA